MNNFIFRSVGILWLFFAVGILQAQSISLPNYTQGVYEKDTIYQYYGSLPSSGQGTIRLDGQLDSSWIAGMHFRLVVDSVDFPTAVVVDSQGTSIAVQAGDVYDLPLSLTVYNGNVGFHLIIEGTPLLSNQAYLCDLQYLFTIASPWNMLITENSSAICQVDALQTINKKPLVGFMVYPNPVLDAFYLNPVQPVKSYSVYDKQGRLVLHQNQSGVNSLKNLTSGAYFLHIKTNKGDHIQRIIKQ
jgi:hypothetical protein